MPALQQGGVEVLVRTLIEDTPEGDPVYLISEESWPEIERSGLGPKIAGHLQVPKGILPASWNDELLTWAASQRIDLCHFHLSGTYGWKSRSWSQCPLTRLAMAGVPTVSTNHQAVTFFDASRPPSPWWRKCAGTLGYWPGKARQLSAVGWEASVSDHDLALSRRSFPGLGGKMLRVYHSRLDAALPVTREQERLSVLNVATVAFRKGQHILAEAFARIAADFPDWTLDLVGFLAEEACVERIRGLIRSHGLADRILLHGSHADPTVFYQNASVYVQPSLLEGLGLSLQEAMFHGKACIGSNQGGIPELIDRPETGALFPAGDSAALAEVLAKQMSDAALRKRLGEAARVSILDRGMTRQAMTATYRALYQKVTG